MRKCPVCENKEIKINHVDMVYECEVCNCAFGSDYGIINNWDHCSDCGDYVAPEDKINKEIAFCRKCYFSY